MKSIVAAIITASLFIIGTQGFVVAPNGASSSSSSSSLSLSIVRRESSSILQMAMSGDLRRPQEAKTGISGTVQRFTGEGGFGFIIPDDGGKNIFFLASAILNKDDDDDSSSGLENLKKGDYVTFDTEVEDDFKDQIGKLKAINVKAITDDMGNNISA